MTYASALPLAFSVATPSPLAGVNRPTRLGDLIGPNGAAQARKLGDLAQPRSLTGPTPGAGVPSGQPSGLISPRKAGVQDSSGPMFSPEGAFMPKMGDLQAEPILSDLLPVDPSQWRTKKPKFFSPEGAGPWVLAALGDALQAWGSGGQVQGRGVQNLVEHRNDVEAREFDREKWTRELNAKREERMRPRLEQVGNTLGWLNEGAGSYSPIYTAPQPFESYARALGHEPGSEGYRQAVEDYRLGGWSDPAVDAKVEFEGVRQGNRRELLDSRLGVTRRGQDMRSSDVRRGQDMADKRARDFHGRKVGGRAVSSSEPMTRLPNGDFAVVRDGRWVNASTGQPVQ